MTALTPKELRFLRIFAQQSSSNESPSLSGIAHQLGYKSVNSVRQFLSSLKKKGINPKEYIMAPLQDTFSTTVSIPVLGSAPCGMPLYAEENIEDHLPVDTSMLSGNPAKYFFLRAKGTSMDLAGIEDGDYVLFKSQNTAELGDKVVVLLGDEVTIKMYKPGDEYVSLVPRSSDPRHQPIIVSRDAQIQGVVRYVIKKNHLT